MALKVAITGATGFVGGHAIAALAKDGHSLRALVRQPPAWIAPPAAPVEIVVGGIEDSAALARLIDGVDAVIAIAGLTKARDRKQFFKINAEAIGKLAALAAQRATPPRFLLLSSLAARRPELSDYAASKAEGEKRLIEAAEGRLPWVILRPPAVYGPGDAELLPYFRAVARGLAPYPASGGRLAMIHGADLGGAIAAAVMAPAAAGQIWEIDDGHEAGYSWPEMAAAAAQALGRPRPPRQIAVPRPIMTLLGRINECAARLTGRPRILTAGKVQEIFQPDWLCRQRPGPDALAWKPRLDLESGFAQTVAWYRERGWI